MQESGLGPRLSTAVVNSSLSGTKRTSQSARFLPRLPVSGHLKATRNKYCSPGFLRSRMSSEGKLQFWATTFGHLVTRTLSTPTLLAELSAIPDVKGDCGSFANKVW